MNHIRLKDVVVTGFALFAMFFGAGNLIFPPELGRTAGTEWLFGFACFIFVEVVLSCIGIYTMIYGGGSIDAIKNVIGKIPSIALNTIIILCTGVLIANPRTAAVTYEMGIRPFTEAVPLWMFSIIFFTIVFIFSIKSNRFVDIIGEYLTPVLVVSILILIVAGLIHPIGPIAPPISNQVAMDGVIAGYQTMDIIAVSSFAIVVLNTLRLKGYTEKSVQLRAVIGVCVVCGVALTIIYGGLAYIGATATSLHNSDMNQANYLVAITHYLLGSAGALVLGVIVTFACLTTSIGLTGATSYYFEKLTNGFISYKTGVIAVVLISFALCNLGLSAIITFAVPVLTTIVPPFMATVLLLLFRNQIKSTFVYKVVAFIALLIGLYTTIQDYI